MTTQYRPKTTHGELTPAELQNVTLLGEDEAHNAATIAKVSREKLKQAGSLVLLLQSLDGSTPGSVKDDHAVGDLVTIRRPHYEGNELKNPEAVTGVVLDTSKGAGEDPTHTRLFDQYAGHIVDGEGRLYSYNVREFNSTGKVNESFRDVTSDVTDMGKPADYKYGIALYEKVGPSLDQFLGHAALQQQ